MEYPNLLVAMAAKGKALRSDCWKGGNSLPNLGRYGLWSIVSAGEHTLLRYLFQ
jgi:hypothetical protein